MAAERAEAEEAAPPASRARIIGWCVAIAAAVAVRLWNALTGPLMWGYDAPGHIAYVFYLDRFASIPWAHQGWGYFHPPLHYVFGWGLLQLGGSEWLLRGLALLGSAASLATAALAAIVTRASNPARPALALLAFISVAFVPVHLYASTMSGNELTCAVFAAAALASLIASERQVRPRLIGDARTGLFVGLALLSKFSGATALAGCLAVVALRPWVTGGGSGARSLALRRAAVLVVVAGVLAGPFYARNLARYGTPFRMNRDYALTADVEERQAPGARSWRDFVAVSPRLLADPRPGAEHLIHSVWGSAYVNAWVDTRALWNRLPEPGADRLRRARVALVRLGLLPTALAVLGAFMAIRDVRRGRRVATMLPLLIFAGLALLAFALFAVRVPRVSALKASYLLGLSLPYGVFVARGVERIARGRWLAVAACLAVVVPSVVAAVSYCVGGVHPRRDHQRTLGTVQRLAGEPAAARAFYRGRLANTPGSIYWKQGLAAVELADGAPEHARSLYREVLSRGRTDPEAETRFGVAEAISGDLAGARRRFDRAIELGGGAFVRANRGSVAAALGDLTGAESDLTRALAEEPGLVVAAHNLAVVHERAGRSDAAASARAYWQSKAAAAPDGYPYGVGVGLLEPEPRPLLWLGDRGLQLAVPPFAADPEPASR